MLMILDLVHWAFFRHSPDYFNSHLLHLPFIVLGHLGIIVLDMWRGIWPVIRLRGEKLRANNFLSFLKSLTRWLSVQVCESTSFRLDFRLNNSISVQARLCADNKLTCLMFCRILIPASSSQDTLVWLVVLTLFGEVIEILEVIIPNWQRGRRLEHLALLSGTYVIGLLNLLLLFLVRWSELELSFNIFCHFDKRWLSVYL